MSHDPTRILMGSVASTFKVIDNHSGSIDAGLAVRLKSDDTLSNALADGALMGISCGLSLSGNARTAIVREGEQVPVLLTTSFSPVIGAQVFISDTTGKAGASGAGFTGVNAYYSSEAKTAVLENGSEVAAGAAYIEFPGGL